ncbi:hypothetical protein [Marinitenerispora sediminis]|uniref:Uncharacterized protein n=1 Tax=Marinitenerispora sediminis TaxID=1931232 RepID=A0A368T0I2_9ACTN|nr:hypothetical protein [Marinitenerispora sediminis]RCV50268.1 hypothetical protein DEF28_18585 [Marinitenerispora sediminis]RCV50477.1 hypothetical protein DEF23_21975 [Marinitenerispora sediminis]RCV52840.1 hypothetical protein DEF24_21415 [Marinitenerispora sediminis]
MATPSTTLAPPDAPQTVLPHWMAVAAARPPRSSRPARVVTHHDIARLRAEVNGLDYWPQRAAKPPAPSLRRRWQWWLADHGDQLRATVRTSAVFTLAMAAVLFGPEIGRLLG